ncbi:TRAP transporter permease DctQ [Bacillus sp. UMB0899]|uniref:TRAP transporter small permease n=1 Tax=Metabacillus schmidteae TaxID=2730405 RepID=UPI000C7F9655|nr:TRAP transporter small permease [Metabacillus schmidteae]PMC38132.1 TRAP transporter permease DctQ [Bacillus sp. UMB0899]
MRYVKKSVDRVIEFLTCALFLVMIAVASWQVLSRFILKNPSTFTEELLRYSLIWLAMLATAYVVGRSEHIAITYLRDRLDEDSAKKLDIVIQAFFLLFSATVMVYGGAKAVSLTMAQISPALHLPMGYVYLALPLSGVFILFYSVINIQEIKNRKKKVIIIEEKKAC